MRMAEASGAYVALNGRNRAWTVGAGKARPTEDSRAVALAELAAQSTDVLWIEDMAEPRWSEAYPRAPGEADYQFYAAAPITLPEGRRIGGWLTTPPSSPMSGSAAARCRRWRGRNNG
jgi:hypothetical protein